MRGKIRNSRDNAKVAEAACGAVGAGYFWPIFCANKPMTSKQSAGILLYRYTFVPEGNVPTREGDAPAVEDDASSAEDDASFVEGDALAAEGDVSSAEGDAPAAENATPTLEVFLVHPGGPFWRNKNEGSWTIPKGEFTNDEPALDAAIREFREETGIQLKGRFQPLSFIKQKGGKKVYAWAIAGDLDPEKLVSNTFEIEWPRKSGKMKTFPEIDKGGWFSLANARIFINPAQISFLDELDETMGR